MNVEGRKDDKKSETHFGPIFSRLYSLFSSIIPSSRAFYRMIAEDVCNRPSGRLLDVGCGSGNLLSVISERNHGYDVYGTDPSTSMIKLASKRGRKFVQDPSMHFKLGSCMDLPFEGSFDIIISSSSYHHWDNKPECLSSLAGRLTRGGLLAIYEHLAKESESSRPSSDTHSLSYAEAETMEIEDYGKEIRVIGPVIAVKFRRKGQ